MLCDDLETWVGGWGGGLQKEGIYVSSWLICIVWQKPVQHCKAIFFQLKKVNSIGEREVNGDRDEKKKTVDLATKISGNFAFT